MLRSYGYLFAFMTTAMCATPQRDAQPHKVGAKTPHTSGSNHHRDTTTSSRLNAATQKPESRRKRTQSAIDTGNDLCNAALQGHLRRIEKLLDRGDDPNGRTRTRDTPIMCASQYGSSEIVTLLLNRGANVNLENLFGDRAINFAVKHPSIRSLLTKNGSARAEQNFEDRITQTLTDQFHDQTGNRTQEQLRRFVTRSLQAARRARIVRERDIFDYTLAQLVFGRHVTTSRRFRWVQRSLLNTKRPRRERRIRFQRQLRKRKLAAIGRLFARDVVLTQPQRFFAAARANQTDVINQMLAKGFPTNLVDAQGRSALFHAACAGHTPIISTLLQAGALIDTANVRGQTPLHCATQNGHLGAVEQLIGHGASLSAMNLSGQIPIELATDFHPIKMRLMQAGSSPRPTMSPVTVPPSSGQPHIAALHDAVRLGDFPKLRTLLNQGVNVNAKDANGESALNIAVRTGNTRIARELLKRGADVNGQGFETALHIAARQNHIPLLQLLISSGAELDRRRLGHRDRSTALMLAARNGHLAASRTLIANGAKVHLTGKDGATALMYAARRGRTKIVKLLLTNGARLTDEDAFGKTALDHATYFGYAKVIESISAAQRTKTD